MIKKLEILRRLIIKHHGYDPKHTRSRKREYVDARKLFSVIVFETKLTITLQFVADYLGIDHATVMHHKRTGKQLINVDKHINRNYIVIKDEYMIHFREIFNDDIENEIFLLETRIKRLKELRNVAV